jgi:hypothetical protein
VTVRVSSFSSIVPKNAEERPMTRGKSQTINSQNMHNPTYEWTTPLYFCWAISDDKKTVTGARRYKQ